MQGSKVAAEKLDVTAQPIQAPRRALGAVHAGIVSLLRADPWWLVERLEQLGVVPPGMSVELRLWPADVPRSPTLRIIRLRGALGILTELQDLIDAMKEERWPELGLAYRPYVGRQIIVVILTFDDEVAEWVRSVMMPKLAHLHVVLLTPGTIPRSSPVDPTRQPQRALLDAMIHVRDETEIDRLCAAILALRELEADEAVLYEEMLMSQLGEELIMTAIQQLRANGSLIDEDDYEPTPREKKSYLWVRGHRVGREEGERLGRAQFLVALLRQRGLEVDAADEAAILECRDLAQFDHWLTRALVVDQARALLDDRLLNPG